MNICTCSCSIDSDTNYDGDDPNQVVDYIYDYKNRLIGKLLDSDGDGDTDTNTTVYWYDAAGRQTHSAFYGREDTGSGLTHYIFDGTTGALLDTDGDNIPNAAEATPPEPNTSDNYIVSKTIYDPSFSDTGSIIQTVDNAGTITETQYDLLRREIRTIQNYENGTVLETELDQDVTTEYQYDAYGRLATLIAYNAKGSGNGVEEQKTVYLYESDYNASWQTAVVYPDSTDTIAQDADNVWSITSGGDHTSTAYDRMGRTITTTDQRGIVHIHVHDTAGRLWKDLATAPGGWGDVDNSVQAIFTTYDDTGRIATITSYGDTSGTSPVNQIEYVYDGWGNLYQEYQEHDGVVDGSTLFTQYTYADGASGGVAKYVRLNEVTYPNDREIHYDYGTTGAIDDIMSRISAIYDDADDDDEIDGGEDVYASYKYLGTATIVEENYEEAEVKLDYNADDNLGGFDRFGRVVDQVWEDYGASQTLDEYTYTYDRAGNRTSKDNELHSDFDETYTYDNLYRLASTTRADGFDQTWTLDGLGNWSEFDNDGSTEDHTVNEANEITDLAGTSVIPTYDTAGNMTSGPAPDNPAVRLHYTYDAWNRLTKVYTDDSGNPDNLIAAYEYDPQNRRIVKGVDDNSDGFLDTFTHYFLNSGNQVLETRTGDDLSGQGPTADSLTPTYQNLWSKRYIDALILRDEYSGGVLQTAARIYYLSDANHNVTALVNTSGAVLERYTYTPYGKVTIYDNTWQNERTTSSYANTTLYTGRTLDPETALMYYRARYYDTNLGRFISRDPIGYFGGINLYRYVNGNPLIYLDPSGNIPDESLEADHNWREEQRQKRARELRQEKQAAKRAAYNKLKTLCKSKNLACPKSECEKQAKAIADAYINIYYEKKTWRFLRPGSIIIGDGITGNYRNGWMCYQWQTIVYNALEPIVKKGKCFTITRVGFIKEIDPWIGKNYLSLKHNWVAITTNDRKLGCVERFTAGKYVAYIDPWYGKGPQVYNYEEYSKEGRPHHNFVGDPIPGNPSEPSEISGVYIRPADGWQVPAGPFPWSW